jgi:hypothetical protein
MTAAIIDAFACFGLQHPHITQFVVYRGSALRCRAPALHPGSIRLFGRQPKV